MDKLMIFVVVATVSLFAKSYYFIFNGVDYSAHQAFFFCLLTIGEAAIIIAFIVNRDSVRKMFANENKVE